jgi:hypothetical protein
VERVKEARGKKKRNVHKGLVKLTFINTARFAFSASARH